MKHEASSIEGRQPADRALHAERAQQPLDHRHLLRPAGAVRPGHVPSGHAWLAAFFGGGQWTRILHPFVGLRDVCVVRFLLVLRFWHHNQFEPGDKQWLRQIDDVLNNREKSSPKDR
jgi:hypothetical protein